MIIRVSRRWSRVHVRLFHDPVFVVRGASHDKQLKDEVSVGTPWRSLYIDGEMCSARVLRIVHVKDTSRCMREAV